MASSKKTGGGAVPRRMYAVLATCCALLALCAGVSLFLLGDAGTSAPVKPAGSDSLPLVGESGYDQNENPIDSTEYNATILPASADAGQTYVDETLFLGDSNTARMYRLFDFCSYKNAIGSVGMSARSLANYACVGFSGTTNYVTMPEAVGLMQPRRVLITFGTNDLNPNGSTEAFISNYQKGIQEVQEAYPSVDIIVNSIPPVASRRSSKTLTQSQADEFNLAIVEMCEQNGWKFLNSAEALKGSDGYARAEYMEADGYHLTRAGLEAMFTYFRTHSWLTEDDRPPLQSIPTHDRDRDVIDPSAAISTPEPSASPSTSPSMSPSPSPSASPSASPSPSPSASPSASPSSEPSPSPTEGNEPSPTTPTETNEPTGEPTTQPTETPTPTDGTGGDPSPAE